MSINELNPQNKASNEVGPVLCHLSGRPFLRWSAKLWLLPGMLFPSAIVLYKLAPAHLGLPTVLRDTIVPFTGVAGMVIMVFFILAVGLGLWRLTISNDQLQIGFLRLSRQAIRLDNIAELRIRRRGSTWRFGVDRGLAFHLVQLSRSFIGCDYLLPPVFQKSIDEIARELANEIQLRTGRFVPIFDQMHCGIPVNQAIDPARILTDPNTMPFLAVNCLRCEYDLRGLEQNGSCPECGTAIATSLQGETLNGVDENSLRYMSVGSTLLVVSAIVAVATIGFIRPGMLPPFASFTGGVLGFITAGVIYVLGSLFFTCRSSSNEPAFIARPRRTARILLLTLPLVHALLGLLHLQWGLAAFLGAIFGLVPTTAPTLWYANTLNTRARESRGGGVIVLSFVLFALLGIVCCLAFMLFVASSFLPPGLLQGAGNSKNSPPTLSDSQRLHTIAFVITLLFVAAYIASFALVASTFARMQESGQRNKYGSPAL